VQHMQLLPSSRLLMPVVLDHQKFTKLHHTSQEQRPLRPAPPSAQTLMLVLIPTCHSKMSCLSSMQRSSMLRCEHSWHSVSAQGGTPALHVCLPWCGYRSLSHVCCRWGTCKGVHYDSGLCTELGMCWDVDTCRGAKLVVSTIADGQLWVMCSQQDAHIGHVLLTEALSHFVLCAGHS
jgi:hypothetical protein